MEFARFMKPHFRDAALGRAIVPGNAAPFKASAETFRRQQPAVDARRLTNAVKPPIRETEPSFQRVRAVGDRAAGP